MAILTWRKLRVATVYVTLTVLSCIFLLPFLYMAGTAFKTYDEIVARPLNPIPFMPTMQNMMRLFEKIPFWTQFLNSVVIAVSIMLLAAFLNSLVAFGFSRYDFKSRNVLFMFVIGTMLVPQQVMLVPSFMMFRAWGWLDTFLPLIVPMSVSAFYVFFIRQVLISIPRELFDSARVDGCSEFSTYARIAVPLSRSAIGVSAILAFMNSWNDYLGPLIYLTSENRMTLAVGISTMNNPYQIDFATPITGSFLMAVPILIMLVIVGQKYFVDGLTAGSIKG